jgi:uncharacterized protein (TIGR02268 family)
VAGERFRLTVRFKAGTAPASAAFWLGVHPGRVEPFIEVYRVQRTVESYQQEVQEKNVQLHQCQEDNARLVAEKESPGGLTGLLTTGLVDDNGIAPKNLHDSLVEHPGNFDEVLYAHSYRAARTVAVVLQLRMKGMSVGRAELVGPGHLTLRVLSVWPREPLSSDVEEGRVIIEAEATKEQSRGSFTLKLWNADGTRSLTVSGVTFP